MSDAVASLVAKRPVRRVADPADRRAALLDLTGDGRATAAAPGSPADVVAGAVERLPAEQQEAVLLSLLRLIGVLAEVGVVSAARTCLTCRFRRQEPEGDHCALLGTPLPVAELRVHCPEHRPAA